MLRRLELGARQALAPLVRRHVGQVTLADAGGSTRVNPSNRSTRPRTRSSKAPASTVTVVLVYSAGVI